MNAAEGYDVLRLIEHGQSCYVSADYVTGRPLIQWLKYHPNLSKEQLFSWIEGLARQLECIHKCRGKPCYQYVNPYSIIVTEEKELYFLDMNAESNARLLPTMRRRSVREYFLPPGDNYYQNATVALDIYGLGRTIQYLLSMSEPEEPLSRREEVRLQKIISKSLERNSGRSYRQVSELRRQLPVYHVSKKIISKKKIAIFSTAVFLLAAVITALRGEEAPAWGNSAAENDLKAGEIHLAESAEKEGAEKESGEKKNREKRTGSLTEAELLEKELGFLYFLDKRDYERSKEHFGRVEGEESAQGMARLAGYMLTGTAEEKEKELGNILAKVDEEIPEKDRALYYRCLLEGYRLIHTKEAVETVIRLGNRCLEEGEVQIEEKLTGYVAAAYENAGEPENAAEAYMKLLSIEGGEAPREELYKKLTLLWEEAGDKGKAGSICREGIEELESSIELRLLHISMQCRDTELDREICAQTIQQYIREIPEITEEQEFQKLAQEYGIAMEGEQVWVGR